jgi:5-methylthioadenosine/S-adenosylhomocysteine deaminase
MRRVSRTEHRVSAALILGGYVYGATEPEAEPVLLTDTAVYHLDGTIAEIGPVDLLRTKYPAAETLGSRDALVLPGFTNAHHHMGLTPFQLGTFDQPLETSFAARLRFRGVDPYLDTLYAAFEMIASGVTTVQHLHNPRRGGPEAWFPAAERILAAYRDVGMRVSYSLMTRVQSRLVYGEDEAFIATLPSALAEQARAHLRGYGAPLDAFLAHFERCHERFNAEPRIRVQLSPGNLHWCTDEALATLADYARRYGVGWHMHLLETPYQRVYAQRRGSRSAVKHLAELGAIGPWLTIGHGVWCDEDDLALLAASNARVCHNASSNLRLHSGIAPLAAYLEREIPIALGIDEAGLADDRDMLAEMRLVSKLHRVPGIGRRHPNANEILTMATENGSRTTGFAGRTGKLAPGYAADAVVIDLAKLAFPYLDPALPIEESILYRAKPEHVSAVLVDGEIMYREGRFTRVDRDAILAELAASLRSPLNDEERRYAAFAEELVPYVTRYYSGWLEGAGFVPFDARNAR